MSSIDLIAATAFGLEAVTIRELQALGYEGKGSQPGWVGFRGDLSAICRANLWLRSADRVLVRMGEFAAQDFGELFDRTSALPWEQWLPLDANFPVNGRSIRSQLSSVPACQKIVKKAIVQRLLGAYRQGSESRRDSSTWSRLSETGARYTIDVALRNNVATLSIDTTGASLHKRGYRTLVGQAPLKETLAAAMVLLSFWKPGRRLLDPFCGSGTIAIEAALIGRQIAPGLNREFAAESWPQVQASLWAAARQEARDLIQPDFEPGIIATDIDSNVLRLARRHAQQAGVASLIHFQQQPFQQLTSGDKHGILITNPPYGQRLGDAQQTEQLYASMPSVLSRLDTWSWYILTSHPDLERLLGRVADRRRKLYNGRIACTYYQFHGPKMPARGNQEETS
jgi:putative N6-adenine-specific DNA methylase